MRWLAGDLYKVFDVLPPFELSARAWAENYKERGQSHGRAIIQTGALAGELVLDGILGLEDFCLPNLDPCCCVKQRPVFVEIIKLLDLVLTDGTRF